MDYAQDFHPGDMSLCPMWQKEVKVDFFYELSNLHNKDIYSKGTMIFL